MVLTGRSASATACVPRAILWVRARGWLPLAMAALALAGPARAVDGAAGETGWVPSLALGVQVQSQTADGFGASSLRGSVAGTQDFLTGVPDLRVELLAPPIGFLPGSPRPFVHGGWQYGWLAFDDTRTIAKEGDVGEIVPPGGSNDPSLVLGQGTSLSANIDNGWYAGLGLAFEVPWREYRFRLKPSLDYYGEHVQIDAIAQNAFLITPGIFFPPPGTPAVFGVDRVVGSDEATLHAMGPRFQLETDVGGMGSLLFSVFADVAAYWFLGNRTIGVVAEGDGTGAFAFTKDETTIMGGAGVRVSWRPGWARR